MPMSLAGQVAQQVRASRAPHLQQDLADLHQALHWAFQDDTGQHREINCFCDHPTEHVRSLPATKQLTLMTYDILGFHGKIEDPNVHTMLFKPSNKPIAQMLKKGDTQRHFTVIVRLKCTPQPEHLAEAIYLHHRVHIEYINAITYVGDECHAQTK